MSDQQLALLTWLMQVYHDFAIILAWYYPDLRKVRYIVCFHVSHGACYAQYPMEY